ncbi:hypothetical protein L2E82_27102 [Cichorium intybus]|uniref:Uncharacterized protein n=1 Tax=Cichorium intybus TaxID=13427 RepID=A0ACB9CS13_CICIN|nr:hypothetical protein L2E82_27102 [Cichorium intybus]
MIGKITPKNKNKSTDEHKSICNLSSLPLAEFLLRIYSLSNYFSLSVFSFFCRQQSIAPAIGVSSSTRGFLIY